VRCEHIASPRGNERPGTKTELKNMNSFKNVQKALDFEVRRQKVVLERGEKVIQETRLWDAGRNVTLSMRGKEEAHDYRYFPDPDLVPIVVSEEWIEEVRAGLPELPDAKAGALYLRIWPSAYDAEC